MSDRADDLRATLERVPLFAGLGDAAIDGVLRESGRRRLRSGEALFRRGDPGAAAWVVLSGRLRVVRFDAEGRTFVLRVLAPGELFGELALLDDAPRSAAVEAAGAAEVLAIPRRAFRALLRDHPDASLRLLRQLAGQVRRLSGALEGAVSLALRARLARALLELGDRFGAPTDAGVRVEMRLSQQAIGELLGVTRESVNKQLSGWLRDGVLAREGGYITLVDVGALRAAAGLDDEIE